MEEPRVTKQNTSLGDKLQSTSTFHHYFRRRPCAHCKLIDKGDVALYQVTCPQCGEIPPSRTHLYPNLSSTDVGLIYKCTTNPVNI